MPPTYQLASQVAAARGFAVFYPNYRGSTARGVEFSKKSPETAEYVSTYAKVLDDLGYADEAKALSGK